MKLDEIDELLNNAEAAIKSSKFADAKKISEEVLSSLSLQPVDSHEVQSNLILRSKALRLLSQSLWNNGRAKEALPYAEEALSTAFESQNREAEARANANIGVVCYYISDYPRALEFYTTAIAIYDEIGEKYKVLSVISNIGNLYLSLGEYPKALEYMNRALAAHNEIGDKSNATLVMGNIGSVYYFIGDYPRALEYLSQTLDAYQQLGNEQGACNSMGNIGSVYMSLADYPRALEYMNRALAGHIEFGNKAEAANVMGNIGNVHLLQNNYTDSLEYMSRALAAHQDLGNKTAEATVLCNMGIIYGECLDFTNALEFYKKGLASHEALGDKSGVAHALTHIGSLYANDKFEGYNSSIAKEYYHRTTTMYQELGSNQKLFEGHHALAKLYQQDGDTAQALYHFMLYHDIEKEVQSEETKKTAQRAAYERQIGEMQREQDVTERILHNILPKEIAHRIRRGDQKIVDSYESVSVLFADIVGFTKLSQRVTPEQLVAGLDGIFNIFDILAEKHGCEKIKTIGDCYMVVAGLPERCENHAERLAFMALDMQKAIDEFPALVADVSISMRIGIHSGSVVAGIIGKNKYAYDLWGDAVNTASRMESHGESGKIHVSEEFTNSFVMTGRNLSKHPDIQFTARGEMDIKGKGIMNTYFLNRVEGNL
ncbi:MAG: tetratricopeptide repeat protein [Ignavibacteria bacterium]|nr:tetratricopeptide repeat protein [Ignavibacteria bacterium]